MTEMRLTVVAPSLLIVLEREAPVRLLAVAAATEDAALAEWLSASELRAGVVELALRARIESGGVARGEWWDDVLRRENHAFRLAE